jgi:ADP-heptose:LPS heptosyltransferase/GT2 family glycosyltransferase
MKPRFTISVLTYVAVRQSKACIASLIKQTLPFKLILTANGNQEAAAFFNQVASEWPNVTVVVNEKNEGFIEPNKHALSLCDTEFFVMVNDDCVMPNDALEKLAAPFERFPDAALSGPKDDYQTLLPNFHGTKGKAFEYLNGACLCCKTEIVRKHGLFDPNLVWAYGDDSDLSLRMRQLGYSLHKVDFKLQHEQGATSRHVKEVRAHQEKNHAYLRRKWAHYLKVRKMDYPVVVKRTGAFGDVLLTTPVIRALKQRHPTSPIYVETACPQIFDRNPQVKQAARKVPPMSDALVYNLDMSYEGAPARHFVKSYALKCGLIESVDQFFDDRTLLVCSDQDRSKAEQRLPDGEWVAIHAGPSTWRSKEWPQERFLEVINVLSVLGHKIVLVGSASPSVLKSDLDLRGKTTIHEMAAVIQRCRLFIGLDSFPFHCAQAVGTPAIGLFGVTDPQWIATSSSLYVGVCGTAPSFGVRHRVPGSTSVDDKGAAMDSISVEMVLKAADKLINVAANPVS